VTIRKYRHPDGEQYKRSARTDKEMTPAELVSWIAVTLGTDYSEPLISGGIHIEWYSPMSPEEKIERVGWAAQAQARQDEWERVTYQKLKEKFENS
jgi:hypothetical protein